MECVTPNGHVVGVSDSVPGMGCAVRLVNSLGVQCVARLCINTDEAFHESTDDGAGGKMKAREIYIRNSCSGFEPWPL